MSPPYRRNEKTAELQLTDVEAQRHFADVVRDVDTTGESVLIDRGGQPVAILVPLDEYRHMQRVAWNGATWSSWSEAFRAARAAFRRHTLR